MIYIADLHIHSKYSRATSKSTDLENLTKWAQIKGIQILGTGDFTHPLWFKEIKNKLESVKLGLYKLKNVKSEMRFILSTEFSCIYTKNNKVRRIHLVVLAPDIEIAEKINQKLGEKYNLKSDGRPILGIDAKELLKILLNISPEIVMIPAHAWTPWFSIFGSKSGFNSVEECFDELAPQIFALETGLSSDPLMNWQWSYLDKYTLISNSDAHSPEKLGREANVFEFPSEPSYKDIIEAIKNASPYQRQSASSPRKSALVYTIEFFPEEGKYHIDGHRACNFHCEPIQTKKLKGICPVCHRPLTVGVLHRVDDLADRAEPQQPQGAPDQKSIIPLKEIIAEIEGVMPTSKRVDTIYHEMIKRGKNEFNILLNLSGEEIKNISEPKIAEAILKMRAGKVIKHPGYDGVFGQIKIFPESPDQKQANIPTAKKRINKNQKSLF